MLFQHTYVDFIIPLYTPLRKTQITSQTTKKRCFSCTISSNQGDPLSSGDYHIQTIKNSLMSKYFMKITNGEILHTKKEKKKKLKLNYYKRYASISFSNSGILGSTKPLQK
jgi:hypothetical protein